MQTMTVDELETDFGTAILSELTGQLLTRNQQSVRLFDQTKHTAEYYFQADERGKPYIQNFAQGKRYYPVEAYRQIHGLDFATAVAALRQTYDPTTPYRPPIIRPRLSDGLRNRSLLPISVEYLPIEVYQRCQCQFEQNGFWCYLSELFSPERANKAFAEYGLGTSGRWQYKGKLATALPQFDVAGRLRQVKVVPFHPLTGRRAKKDDPAQKWNQHRKQHEPDGNDKVWFAGRSLSTEKEPNLRQCYFGEHLLVKYPQKIVALVEGESTAVVCSIKWPQYVWIATGGSNGGRWDTPERLEVLRDRKITLWPDSGKYDEWSAKAQPLHQIASSFIVSRYVEDNVPAGAGNVDLRDLLTWPRYITKDGKIIFGEVLPVGPADAYPPEWDEPNPINATPTIKAVHCADTKAFHQWQHPYVSGMEIVCLPAS